MSHPRFSGPRFGGNNLYNKTGGIGTGTGAPGFTQRYANNRHDREGGGNMNVAYDGKRMRNKSVLRKTVDYSAACISFLENRLWQRDFRDRHRLQPDELYIHNLTPPQETIENPMNCVTTRFVRNSMNKLRCPIFCVCWTPEGRRLVTGASSGEFTLWNGLTFSFETILQAHDTSVRCMTWSHNDQWMLTADHGGFVKYWQSNMNNVKMYQAHKEAIRGISFCPTDQKYATCSDDGTVRVWDFIRCHEEKILRGHGADVKCVDWHPQKSLIASGSKDTQQPLKLWDPRMGESLATIHAHKHTVMEVQWNRNGNWLLTASRDHLLKLFDVRNMKEEIQSFKGHKKEATTVAWHPIHEGLFTSGGSDGAILFWLVGNEKEVGAIDEAHETMVWSLAWHPLGHILVSGSNDHSTKFWTRNRPGDAMRDKYNLNTLPQGLAEDMLEYESGTLSTINIPGMGLQTSTSSTDATKKVEVPEPKKEPAAAIPGLDFDAMPNHGGAADKASVRKKIPYAKPVPKEFEKAWSGGAQPPSFRPNKPPPPGPSIPGGPNLNMPNIPGLSGLPFGLNIPGLPELAGILASANPLLPGSQQQDGPDQKPPRQGLLGDGPPSGPPGPPDQRENNGHPDQGPPGMRPPNMGPQGQNMRPPGPNMGPQGQNIRPQNMGGPNMGPGGPNMGPGGPNMGPGGPNMGPGGPNMGPGGPNMGQGGPNMGPGGPNMGQQGQNMGQPPGMNIRPPGPNMRPGGHNMGQQRGQGQFMGGGANMGPNQDRRQHMQGGMGPGGGNMNQRGNMGGPMGGVDNDEFEDMDGGPRGNFGGGRGGGQQGPGGAFNQDEDEEGQQRMEAMNWAGDNTDQSEGGFHGGGGSGGGSRGRRQDWGSDGGGHQHSQERSQSQDRNQEFNRNSSDNANNRKRGHESRYAGWKLDNEDSGDYKFGRGEHNRGGGGGGRGQSSRGQWGGNRGRGGRGGFDGGYKGRGEGGRGRSRGGWRGR